MTKQLELPLGVLSKTGTRGRRPQRPQKNEGKINSRQSLKKVRSFKLVLKENYLKNVHGFICALENIVCYNVKSAIQKHYFQYLI